MLSSDLNRSLLMQHRSTNTNNNRPRRGRRRAGEFSLPADYCDHVTAGYRYVNHVDGMIILRDIDEDGDDEASNDQDKDFVLYGEDETPVQVQPRSMLISIPVEVDVCSQALDATYKDTPQRISHSVNPDHEEDIDEQIARTTVRLDGLEVYAVVSALTCATLYQCFESFNGDDWGPLYREGKYIKLFGDVVFLFSSATGILAGLHATLVFSLMTMYGRTAIGIGRDDAFDAFFEKTGQVRFRGFQTFVWSMYSFMVQVGIVITSKVPTFSRTLFIVSTVYSVFQVYKDTQHIVKAAGIMFVAPSRTTPGAATQPQVARNKGIWIQQPSKASLKTVH